MRFYIDLDSLDLIETATDLRKVARVEAKRGDDAPFEVVFLRTGVAEELAEDTVITFGAKRAGKYDGPAMILHSGFELTGEAETAKYTGTPSLNTEALNALFKINSDDSDDPPHIDLMAEFTWRVGDGAPTSTKTFQFRVHNDVIRGDEGAPSTLPTPDDEWVAHGHAQELTFPQRELAKSNIGLAGVYPAIVVTAADEDDEMAILEANGFMGMGQMLIITKPSVRRVYVATDGDDYGWTLVSNPLPEPEPSLWPEGNWPANTPFVALRTASEGVLIHINAGYPDPGETGDFLGVFELTGDEWKLRYTDGFVSGEANLYSDWMTGAPDGHIYRLARVSPEANSPDGIEVLTGGQISEVYFNALHASVVYLPPSFTGHLFYQYTMGGGRLDAPGVSCEALHLNYSDGIVVNIGGASVNDTLGVEYAGFSYLELDAIFAALAPGAGDIFVAGNHGAALCDASIAENKGYGVHGTT